MKFTVQLIVFLVALAVVNSEKVKLENVMPCSNIQSGSNLMKVNLNESSIYTEPSPCEGGIEFPRCKVPRGTKIKLEAHFIANQNTASVRQQITANLTGGLNVVFPGLKISACKHRSIKCPVALGAPVIYNITIAVQPYYPTVTGIATVNLIGKEGTLFCFSFPVEVI